MLSSQALQSPGLCSSRARCQVAAVAPHRSSTSRRAPQHQHHHQQQQQQHFGSAQAAAWQQQRARVQLARAVKDEEAEIDRITKEAAQSDIWGSELVGNAVKVGIVAGVLAAVLLIANLAKPLYDNTIKSFPTPAEYEQYEQREEGL